MRLDNIRYDTLDTPDIIKVSHQSLLLLSPKRRRKKERKLTSFHQSRPISRHMHGVLHHLVCGTSTTSRAITWDFWSEVAIPSSLTPILMRPRSLFHTRVILLSLFSFSFSICLLLFYYYYSFEGSVALLPAEPSETCPQLFPSLVTHLPLLPSFLSLFFFFRLFNLRHFSY